MAQDLVDRFNLKGYYKAKYTEEAIQGIQNATDISVSKEGVISVKVEDKDPKLAADIANAYVTNLDRLFAKLGTTRMRAGSARSSPSGWTRPRRPCGRPRRLCGDSRRTTRRS